MEDLDNREDIFGIVHAPHQRRETLARRGWTACGRATRGPQHMLVVPSKAAVTCLSCLVELTL